MTLPPEFAVMLRLLCSRQLWSCKNTDPILPILPIKIGKLDFNVTISPQTNKQKPLCHHHLPIRAAKTKQIDHGMSEQECEVPGAVTLYSAGGIQNGAVTMNNSLQVS